MERFKGVCVERNAMSSRSILIAFLFVPFSFLVFLGFISDFTNGEIYTQHHGYP